MTHQDPSSVLPMWRGRRGMLNTMVCGALGLAAAFALWTFAARVAVIPACNAYGRVHGMSYVDYKVYTTTRRASSACILRAPAGATHNVSLPDAASYFTDLWVGIAFSPELSMPAFTLLFAVALTRWTGALAGSSFRSPRQLGHAGARWSDAVESGRAAQRGAGGVEEQESHAADSTEDAQRNRRADRIGE